MKACNTKGAWFEPHLKLNFLCQLPPMPLTASHFELSSFDSRVKTGVQVIVTTIKPKFFTVHALLWMDFSNLGDVGTVVPTAGEWVNLTK